MLNGTMMPFFHWGEWESPIPARSLSICRGARSDEITVDTRGWGEFPVKMRSVSVWVEKK